MKQFQCSYVAKDRPESMEVRAKDAGDAVAAALTQLNNTPYKRIELFDEHGLIFFRQAPSRLVKANANTRRYFPTPGASSSTQGTISAGDISSAQC